MDTIIAAIITAGVGAIATTLAAYIGRTKGRKEGRQEGYAEARQTFERRLEAAPIQYVSELDNLIGGGVREGLSRVRVNARAIVSARNSLRDSLETISKSLNSEIDRLGKEIENTNIDDQELMQTIETLVRVWPAKKRQIVVEVRKAIVEMGLLERPVEPRESPRQEGGHDPWHGVRIFGEWEPERKHEPLEAERERHRQLQH